MHFEKKETQYAERYDVIVNGQVIGDVGKSSTGLFGAAIRFGPISGYDYGSLVGAGKTEQEAVLAAAGKIDAIIAAYTELRDALRSMGLA